ncbi:MAG: catDE operon transcriptional regulator CatR [Anaerolineae bacterium]
MRYSHNICGRYQRAVEILGKRWTELIIKVLMDGPMRFSELAEQLEVVSDRVISERLKELEAEGIVTRNVIPDTPVRVEYALTDKGRALKPVLEALAAWAERWMDVPEELAGVMDEH